jgi:hypothetical protein
MQFVFICCLIILCVALENEEQRVYAFSTFSEFSDTTEVSTDSLSSTGQKKGFFKELGEDFVLQATSPLRMNSHDALYLGGAATITGILFIVDQKLDDEVKPFNEKSQFSNATSPIVTEFGGKYGIAGSLLFGGYSLVAGDKKAQETSILLANAIITSGVWSRIGKLALGRERPSAAYSYSQEPGGRWHGPLQQFHKGGSVTQYDAFPSGHMATAFAIATVFAEQYTDHKIIPVIAYSAASIIGLTRMIEHTHWASDVFAGSVLGYVCAQQVISHHRSSCQNESTSVSNARLKIEWWVGSYQGAPSFSMMIIF